MVMKMVTIRVITMVTITDTIMDTIMVMKMVTIKEIGMVISMV